MKKLKVILSKSTGYTYLEAKVVKEHIDALEEGRENDEFENRLRYDEVSSELESLKKKISLNGKIDILSRLYQIWAMIPLTAGMNARKEIKKLIDEIEKAPLHS